MGDKSAGIDQDVSGLGADKKTQLDDQFEIATGSDADIDYSDVGEPGSEAPEEKATPETTLAKNKKYYKIYLLKLCQKQKNYTVMK